MVQKINTHPAPGYNRSPPYYVFSKDAILGSVPSISSEVLGLANRAALPLISASALSSALMLELEPGTTQLCLRFEFFMNLLWASICYAYLPLLLKLHPGCLRLNCKFWEIRKKGNLIAKTKFQSVIILPSKFTAL